MDLTARTEALRKALEETGCSRALITNPKSVRYLCRFSGSQGALIVAEDELCLVTDGRYWSQAEREAPHCRLFRYQHQGHGSFVQGVVAALGKCGRGPVALETDRMLYHTFLEYQREEAERGVAFHPWDGAVAKLREIKDPTEVDALRRAAEIADLALSRTLQRSFLGCRELELKAELEYQLLLAGGEGTSFDTIVASGPNGALPHAGASARVIGEGELVTIDFGTVCRGYCSDMTRTIWYGELGAEDRRMLGAVRRAQSAALDAVRPGIECGRLDEIARSALREEGLAELFLHSLGHGVGLDIHESPSLRSGRTETLQIGQVVTIEPGVYREGETGCRVEDTVVVTDGPPLVLNRYPKQSLEALEPPTLPS